MYKLLLCWRYLRTRYIALASIISVTLGVATMIVVNSVMAGISHETQGRIHGILSDIALESHGAEGFSDPAAHMERIRKVAGNYIAGMTPSLSIPAMLSFQVQGSWHQRQVTFIGIDPATYGSVGDFNQYLQHPANRQALEFTLRNGGYDTVDHNGGKDALPRRRMDVAGWTNRRMWAEFNRDMKGEEPTASEAAQDASTGESPSDPPPETLEQDGWVFERGEPLSEAEVATMAEAGRDFNPAQETHSGIVMGMALACYRLQDGTDNFFLLPGDDVEITVPTAGTPLKMVPQLFTIVDFYESKLPEYDSTLIFAPLEAVQRMRETYDAQSGIGSATSVQIKLHDEANSSKVRELLRAEFPAAQYGVETWREKQGPLLEAVKLEITILNILLFMIIAVAGFGILAIFYMIVVEKTRDIGILKSLGAPSRGILGVFLAYGLGLGVVGSGAGMVLGLLLVANINYVAEGLTAIIDRMAAIVGLQGIDTTIYYIQEIPVLVQPTTVAWIVGGAMLIAVAASILPARRAAALHPVEALRNKQ